MMRLELVTAPASEPITLADAKKFLRVTHAHEDDLIGLLITAARQAAEARTGRALITQTWRLQGIPDGDIVKLPHSPVAAITSVADGRGALGVDDYAAVLGDFAKIGARWQGEVTIIYSAGYGSAGTAVPANIRLWMQMRICTLYENREQVVIGADVAELPSALVDGLLDPYLAGW